MATTTAILYLLFLLLPSLSSTSPSPYLSPTTLFQNYQTMLASFKIFIYTPSKPFNFPSAPSSLFYTSLLHSPFLTENPNEAHMFLVPFSPDTSTRSVARVVRELRTSYPFWNRTLGADHFFVSPAGIDYSSDRNVLELKKNAVQVSLFPVVSGLFVPHKDIALPPFSAAQVAHAPPEKLYLGYIKWDGTTESNLVNGLKGDAEFVVEEESGPLDYVRVGESRFCLFLYGGDVAWLAGAMASGCVPVVIVDRPIQDLPLMDVVRWADVALLVGVPRGGVKRLKEVLEGVSEERYEEMRGLGVAASRHLVWNEEPRPLDAFHMVIYQLWLRRHVVRYARSEFDSEK